MTSIHTSAILIITDDRILVHYMIKNWPEKNVIQIITIKILTGQRVRRITNKNRLQGQKTTLLEITRNGHQANRSDKRDNYDVLKEEYFRQQPTNSRSTAD